LSESEKVEFLLKLTVQSCWTTVSMGGKAERDLDTIVMRDCITCLEELLNTGEVYNGDNTAKIHATTSSQSTCLLHQSSFTLCLYEEPLNHPNSESASIKLKETIKLNIESLVT
jgi:hypothetical protein